MVKNMWGMTGGEGGGGEGWSLGALGRSPLLLCWALYKDIRRNWSLIALLNVCVCKKEIEKGGGGVCVWGGRVVRPCFLYFQFFQSTFLIRFAIKTVFMHSFGEKGCNKNNVNVIIIMLIICDVFAINRGWNQHLYKLNLWNPSSNLCFSFERMLKLLHRWRSLLTFFSRPHLNIKQIKSTRLNQTRVGKVVWQTCSDSLKHDFLW